MFLPHASNRRGYNSHGEQFASGKFLIVFDHPTEKYQAPDGKMYSVLYACVRKVSLRQLGHFMMGMARIGGYSFSASGALGHDGLPMPLRGWKYGSAKGSPMVDVPFEDIRKHLVRVPDEVATAYWTDTDGHNDVGRQGGHALRHWVLTDSVFKGIFTHVPA